MDVYAKTPGLTKRINECKFNINTGATKDGLIKPQENVTSMMTKYHHLRQSMRKYVNDIIHDASLNLYVVDHFPTAETQDHMTSGDAYQKPRYARRENPVYKPVSPAEAKAEKEFKKVPPTEGDGLTAPQLFQESEKAPMNAPEERLHVGAWQFKEIEDQDKDKDQDQDSVSSEFDMNELVMETLKLPDDQSSAAEPDGVESERTEPEKTECDRLECDKGICENVCDGEETPPLDPILKSPKLSVSSDKRVSLPDAGVEIVEPFKAEWDEPDDTLSREDLDKLQDNIRRINELTSKIDEEMLRKNPALVADLKNLLLVQSEVLQSAENLQDKKNSSQVGPSGMPGPYTRGDSTGLYPSDRAGPSSKGKKSKMNHKYDSARYQFEESVHRKIKNFAQEARIPLQTLQRFSRPPTIIKTRNKKFYVVNTNVAKLLDKVLSPSSSPTQKKGSVKSSHLFSKKCVTRKMSLLQASREFLKKGRHHWNSV